MTTSCTSVAVATDVVQGAQFQRGDRGIASSTNRRTRGVAIRDSGTRPTVHTVERSAHNDGVFRVPGHRTRCEVLRVVSGYPRDPGTRCVIWKPVADSCRPRLRAAPGSGCPEQTPLLTSDRDASPRRLAGRRFAQSSSQSLRCGDRTVTGSSRMGSSSAAASGPCLVSPRERRQSHRRLTPWSRRRMGVAVSFSPPSCTPSNSWASCLADSTTT